MPTCVLHTVFLENKAEICEKKKKTQSNVFLLNQRPHAKIQLIWTTFKKRPKSSLTPVVFLDLSVIYANDPCGLRESGLWYLAIMSVSKCRCVQTSSFRMFI